MVHLLHSYQHYYESSIYGRYINSDHIKGLLKRHSNHFDVSVIGSSVLGEDIQFIKVGNGKLRILMWSQMHGNESTTTKALFDLLNVLSDNQDVFVEDLLNKITIGIIPMLNPDGSRAYTRLNANQVDLNRDAQDLTQPESRVLRSCFNSFKPDYCFNLHGQRTIFSAGIRNKPATVSFLSPAQDKERSVTVTRRRAMDVIVKMNSTLQEVIPGQVGIYDDAFNINCVGDTFQSMNVPTVLFEAGHYENDYNREVVRGLMFQSLWTSIVQLGFEAIPGNLESAYSAIPKNEKLFYDIIIRNVKLEIAGNEKILDLGIQYEERLEQNQIVFVPRIIKIADLSNFYGHRELDAQQKTVEIGKFKAIKEGVEIDFVILNNEKHSLNVEIK